MNINKPMSTKHLGFPPVIGENPRILILGTFPSPMSRMKNEYYGNPRNRFWNIIFDLFSDESPCADYPVKTELLLQNKIALWDVIKTCEADSALDSSIKNPVYNTDLPSLLADNRTIELVLFNGGNAYSFYRKGIGEIEKKVLPSTSPANARMSYAEKLETWKKLLLCGAEVGCDNN